MTVFQIPETFNKSFMNLLLRDNIFDMFDMRTVEIVTFARFEISGASVNGAPVGIKENRDKENFDETSGAWAESDKSSAAPTEKPVKQWCQWGELRPYVFNIIRGGSRPKLLKVILSIPVCKLETIHKNAGALFLNIVYENNSITCVAATGQKSFTMDKTLDIAWDEYIKNFFKSGNIVFGLG